MTFLSGFWRVSLSESTAMAIGSLPTVAFLLYSQWAMCGNPFVPAQPGHSLTRTRWVPSLLLAAPPAAAAGIWSYGVRLETAHASR
jgi:hypothetical protein